MEFLGSAANGRRAASVFSSGAFRAISIALLALLGIAWSGQSLAQSCDFVSLTPGTQVGAPGDTVSFTLEAQTACNLTVDISLTIGPGDTTGGAAVVPPTNPTIALDTPYAFQVDLGTTPGGSGTVIATCLNGGCAGDTLTFNFATSNISYTALGATNITASQTTSFTFGTHLEINGSPSSAIPTTFTNVTTAVNYGTITPDAGGDAETAPITINTAGGYTLRATPQCPVAAPIPGCSALLPIDYNLTVEPTAVTHVTAATETIVSGDDAALTARYGSANVPMPDGTTLTWTVTQPAGGNGSVVGDPIAGGDGESDALFTATVPGTYTVTANSGCTFCAPGLVSFTVTVTAAPPFNLAPVSADPATGDDGDPIVFTVALDQGGTPFAGGTIQWSAGFPFSPATASSTTDLTGEASATFTPTAAGSFSGVVTALYDPDGIPSNGDEVTYAFGATINAVLNLSIEQGDGQTSPVGVPYTDNLMVYADDSGVDAAGVGIDWVVTSGNATLGTSTPTDATGISEIQVTPTAAGAVTVTATRQDNPAATVTFNLTATPGAPTITRVSANPAAATVGTGEVFTVLAEQGGIPVNGGSITWSATAPFSPASASGTTDAAGEASATFTPSSAGNFTNAVSATYDPDGIPSNGDEVSVSFDANVTAVPTLVIDDGDGQNSPVGTPYATDLAVIAQNSGLPAGGVTILWAVTTGTATVVDNGPTDFTGGMASATVTPTSSGTITITATRSDAPTATVTFNLTATGVHAMTPVTADPASATVGSPQVFTVAVDQGGTPVVGGTVIWSAAAPFTPGTASSGTNAAGEASATFTPTAAGSFTNVVTATFDPDGIPANGDEVSYAFDANVAAVPTLVINGGNGQTTEVNTTFAAVLSVIAENSGAPAAGVTIDWVVTAGTATVVDSGVTDAAAGEAHLSVTPTSVGAITITATRSDAPAATVTFNLTSTAAAPFSITTVSANPASGTVGAPMVFTVAVDQGGTPVVGDGVSFTANAPFSPGSAVDTTDAAGEASATFTPSAAGSFVGVVTATYDPDGIPANGDEVSVSFDANIAAIPKTLTAVSANPASGLVGDPIDFTVLLEQGGIPVNAANIAWSATAPFAPPAIADTTDAAGESTATFTPSAAGTFVGAVTALYDGDGIPANGDELTVVFDVDVTAVQTLTMVAGDGQTTTVGTSFPLSLEVLAEDSGTPVAALPITWTLTSGSAVIDTGGQTDAAGISSAAITASAAGPIVITAARSDAPTVQVTFNLTAVPAAFSLTTVSANPASGTVGTPIPMTVELLQGGTPVVGATMQWSAGAPFTPTATTSATSGSGQASANFTASAAGSFPGAITATFDPDGIPANGDELSVSFDANIAAVATLAITGGDGQAALAGSAFALPLEVLAENSGVPAAGVGITWAVTGDATVTPSGATDATGAASATVTAGATAGAVAVTATRQDAPGVSVTFNLTVSGLGSLTIASGDGQRLAAGVPSAPLEVQLVDAGGSPVAGASIGWATSAGTLGSATSVTNAAGIASNTVTASATGEVEVTATSPLAAAPAIFVLNGRLGNLVGLDPVQAEIVDAIDTLCPALEAMATLTPAQADLLARCQELTDAGGIDPDATIDAIDELMTDVAMAQGNAARLALQAQFQNLKTRIAALRSGTQGTSFGGLAVNTPTGPMSLETLSTAFAAEDDEEQAAAEAATGEIGTDFSRWGFFAAGTIGRGEAEEGRIDPAFDYDIEGLTAGFDYRKGDNWIFGGAFGYTRQDTVLPGGDGSVDTSGWTLSAYSTYYTPDSWYADGVLTMGRNDYDMVRRIDYTVPLAGGGTSTIAQTARANAGGDLLSAAFTVGRDFNRGALGIGPYARLLYTRVGFDAIEEELVTGLPGSGLGLRVEERELTSLATQIGGKLTYTHSTDWGVLMPHLQLEWEHEFKDDPQAIEARFLNDPTGTGIFVRGDELDTDYFRIGLGLSMVLTKGRSGFIYYEHLLGRDGYSQYNLALGLRLEF